MVANTDGRGLGTAAVSVGLHHPRILRLRRALRALSICVKPVRCAAPAILAFASAACTTFGAPRSAEVRPGWTTSFQATATTPVDDESGWFWSYDCASNCGHAVVAPEVAVTWSVIEPGSPPAAIGLGINGTYPFLDVYVQAGCGERPFGFGGRAGSMGTWHELRLYGRYDIPTSSNGRLLLNPALFLLTGNSPNGANPGTFAALVQSVGFEARGDRVSAVPGASVVLGRGVRTSFGDRIGPFTTFFATLSIRLTFLRRPREPDEEG